MRQSAIELTDGEAEYVSVVERGANRRPWKARKADDALDDDGAAPPDGATPARKRTVRRIKDGIANMLAMLRGLSPEDPMLEKLDGREPAPAIQTLVLLKSRFSRDAAVALAEARGLKADTIEETDAAWHLVQFAAEAGDTYRTQLGPALGLPEGASAVIAKSMHSPDAGLRQRKRKPRSAHKLEGSLSDFQAAVNAAVAERYPYGDGQMGGYVRDLFEDAVIVSVDGELLRHGITRQDDGSVRLDARPVEVRATYEAVEKSVRREGDVWNAYGEGGALLGSHDSPEQAAAQLRAADAGRRVAAVLKAGDIEHLARHYEGEEHPFAACYDDMIAEGYTEEQARAICGRVKHTIEGATAQEDKTAMTDIEKIQQTITAGFAALPGQVAEAVGAAVKAALPNTERPEDPPKDPDPAPGDPPVDAKKADGDLAARVAAIEGKVDGLEAAVSTKVADTVTTAITARLTEMESRLKAGVDDRAVKFERRYLPSRKGIDYVPNPEAPGAGGKGVFDDMFPKDFHARAAGE